MKLISTIFVSMMLASAATAQNFWGLTVEEFSQLEQSEGYAALGRQASLSATAANLQRMIEQAKDAKANFTSDKVDRDHHYQVVLQVGHIGRTSGATGSTGALIEEQQGAALIAELVSARLTTAGVDHIVIDADSWEYDNGVRPNGTLVKTDIFLSLHMDGSKKPCASAPSLGYNPKFGKESMQLFGAGLAIALDLNAADFMRDNFTANLSHYGDYGRSNSQIAEGIVELTEVTCRTDEEKFLLNAEAIADNLAVAFSFALKD